VNPKQRQGLINCRKCENQTHKYRPAGLCRSCLVEQTASEIEEWLKEEGRPLRQQELQYRFDAIYMYPISGMPKSVYNLVASSPKLKRKKVGFVYVWDLVTSKKNIDEGEETCDGNRSEY
jgi:hypothetical protein